MKKSIKDFYNIINSELKNFEKKYETYFADISIASLKMMDNKVYFNGYIETSGKTIEFIGEIDGKFFYNEKIYFSAENVETIFKTPEEKEKNIKSILFDIAFSISKKLGFSIEEIQNKVNEFILNKLQNIELYELTKEEKDAFKIQKIEDDMIYFSINIIGYIKYLIFKAYNSKFFSNFEKKIKKRKINEKNPY